MMLPMETPKRVLIVDDEPKIGKIFGLQLKLAGYDVQSTTSGANAIDLVRREHFDVLLLDLMMPGVTGLDVLSEVRKFSRVPVILFTGRDDIFEIARRQGANDYIAKPLDPDLLVEKIKSLLGQE
jgi:two-component system, OmpR family, alkaline phosphatase synthesis response regulator PhoP